mgnify:CR=1 FL=1
MPSGDFTQEAYQQLRDAYANSLSTQEEQEIEGRTVLGQQMSLETLPVDSPWRDKIKDWQYPDGKTEYQDGKQSPDEILQLMRDSVTEKKAADEEAETLSDEELDAILDEILEEGDDDDDESGEDESEAEEEDEDEDEEVEEEEEDEEEEENAEGGGGGGGGGGRQKQGRRERAGRGGGSGGRGAAGSRRVKAAGRHWRRVQYQRSTTAEHVA